MTNRTPLTMRQKARMLESQQWRCAVTKCRVRIGNGFGDQPFEDDHHVALVDGGTNDLSNRRLICAPCHREKSALEHKANSKAKRLRYGKTRDGPPMPGSRASKFKRHLDGRVTLR